MDEVTRGRLKDILEVADELAQDLEGQTLESFRADKRLHRVAERLIEIAGEAATHVIPEVADAIEADWRNLRAMRVVLAHAYRRIIVDRLWKAAIADLPRFAAAVRAYLESKD